MLLHKLHYLLQACHDALCDIWRNGFRSRGPAICLIEFVWKVALGVRLILSSSSSVLICIDVARRRLNERRWHWIWVCECTWHVLEKRPPWWLIWLKSVRSRELFKSCRRSWGVFPAWTWQDTQLRWLLACGCKIACRQHGMRLSWMGLLLSNVSGALCGVKLSCYDVTQGWISTGEFLEKFFLSYCSRWLTWLCLFRRDCRLYCL